MEEFEGADGSQPSDWRLVSGGGGIVSGEYVMSGDQDTLLSFVPGDFPEWKNVRMSVDVKLNAGSAWSGPAFRVNYSANSYYYARIQAGSPGKLEIVKVIRGSPTVISRSDGWIGARSPARSCITLTITSISTLPGSAITRIRSG